MTLRFIAVRKTHADSLDGPYSETHTQSLSDDFIDIFWLVKVFIKVHYAAGPKTPTAVWVSNSRAIH